MPTGLELPFGIKPVNPVPVDAWSGPYTGIDEIAAKNSANSSIPTGVRFQSMEVRLVYGGSSYKFWYKDGITDNDLVLFSAGGGGGIFEILSQEAKTTHSVSFDSDNRYNSAKGSDVFFSVSDPVNHKVALFEDDLVVSGSSYFNCDILELTGTLGVEGETYFSGDIVEISGTFKVSGSAEFKEGSTGPIAKFVKDISPGNTQTIFWVSSSSGGTGPDPSGGAGSDVHFYVAGTPSQDVALFKSDLATSGTINVSTSGKGVKLPAIPGNSDPSTLDCYSETLSPFALYVTDGTTTLSSPGDYQYNSFKSIRIGSTVTVSGALKINTGVIPGLVGRVYLDLTGLPAPSVSAAGSVYAYGLGNNSNPLICALDLSQHAYARIYIDVLHQGNLDPLGPLVIAETTLVVSATYIV